MSGCEHLEFEAAVSVGRLTDGEGALKAFTADVHIRCASCGRQFQFLGLPAGVDPRGATVSVDGLEARLAICPQGEAPSALDRLAGAFVPAVRH